MSIKGVNLMFCLLATPGAAQEATLVQPTKQFLVPAAVTSEPILAAASFGGEVAIAVRAKKGFRAIVYDARNLPTLRGR